MNVINRRLLSQVIVFTRPAYPFSKDPFQKFHRNKPTPDAHPEGTKARQPSKPAQTDRKQPHFVSTKETKNHQQEVDPLNLKMKEDEQKARQQGVEEKEKGSKQTGTSKGFERFSRPKAQEQPAAKSFNQSLDSSSKPAQQSEIPKITIENDEGEEKPSPICLRKRSSLRNKSAFFKQKNEPIGKEDHPPEEKEQEKEEKQEEPSPEEVRQAEEKKRWKDFEMTLCNKLNEKIGKKQNIVPRYERENLIKKEKNKESEQEKQAEPADLKSYLLKMAAAGLALAFLSWNDWLESKPREIAPEGLKEALEADRIESTWFFHTDSDGSSEEHIKGKYLRRFVYAKEINGEILFCVSNPEFEQVWLQLLMKHNQRVGDGLNGRVVVLGPTMQKHDFNYLGSLRGILSVILLYYFIKSLTQAGGMKGGMGKGGIKGIAEGQKSYLLKEPSKVMFKDVMGMQKAKQEIVEFIDFLQKPEKYNRLGARIPKGALLTGPPGTGKTMLAKACAGESQVSFYTISGSEFIEMYVGVGAQRVRNLFKEAKEHSPSIIFIDEIDAVGKKRTGGFGGGNDERDTTLNQLLVEMDGFDSTTNVIVFAATNQKEVLDPALTRPGRFDRLIDIQLPDLEGRKEIFQVHLRPLALDRHIDLNDYAKRLATLTPGFSGADIKNVCNEAAIIAARHNKESVSIMDFQLATQRIIGGVQKKSQLITEETRKTVAYHQCGHGVVSWFLEHSSPLLKLTIIPRSKGALGFAQYLPNEQQMYTRTKLLDEICVILGGRVSEEVFFGKISTGASDDLNKAYQLAKTLVTHYGFGQRLGWLQYDETQYAKEYSRDVEDAIDAEILEIMRTCKERTKMMVTEKKEMIGQLAQRLLQEETVDQNVIEEILGPRPFGLTKQHQQYLKEKKRISEDIKQERDRAAAIRGDWIL